MVLRILKCGLAALASTAALAALLILAMITYIAAQMFHLFHRTDTSGIGAAAGGIWEGLWLIGLFFPLAFAFFWRRSQK